MVHTLPDYSSKYKNTTLSNITDYAELAARLESIVTHDRRGNVVWLENFEHGINRWWVTGSGVGNSQTISATTSRSGDSSLKLVTGNTLAHQARARKLFQYPSLVKHGLEFSFTYGTDFDYMRVWFNIRDGADVHYIGLEIDNTNQRVEYWDDAGNWVPTGITFTEVVAWPMFVTVKIVADASTDLYTRLIFGEQEVDLSAHGLQVLPAPGAPYIDVFFDMFSTAGNNATMYIDDIILTQNEV